MLRAVVKREKTTLFFEPLILCYQNEAPFPPRLARIFHRHDNHQPGTSMNAFPGWFISLRLAYEIGQLLHIGRRNNLKYHKCMQQAWALLAQVTSSRQIS